LREGLEDGATAGGGLRSEPGSTTTLNRVVVANNTAGGNAGGILNRGTMTLNASTVSGNRTTDASLGGGGIFNSPNAVLTLNDSRVLDNVAEVASDVFACSGGGIFNDADAVLTLDNSVIDGNIADGRQLAFIQAFGGGIRAGGTVQVIQSSVTNNLATGETAEGGGIFFVMASTGLIDRSVVSFNVAADRGVLATSEGGGINSRLAAAATIQDSVISGNEAEAGGGLHGRFDILRSTLANNRAIGDVNDSRGGGIAITGSSEIVNTTIIGNVSDGDGGGIHYAFAVGTGRIRSSTIAGNASGENGGGIHVESGNFVFANTVLAGNTVDSNGAECSGTITSDGNNLVQSIVGCAFVATTGDRLNNPANLAPVANNGGPTAGSSLGIISGMQTRAPLPDSLLLDAGAASGCTDANGQPLATDQVGRARAIDGPDADTTARCDIGAIEFADAILVDGFE
jgi:fibronectin-binding autotransporter adhesin